MTDDAVTVDAVILAGGTARRMGGVDKPGLTVGGVSLVQRAIDAAASCRHIVVVGPHRAELETYVKQVREDPAGGGPVAAIAAGLAALGPDIGDVVLVLAADVPFVGTSTVAKLVRAAAQQSAAFVVDEAGRTQYLLGAWQRRTLVEAVTGLDTVHNAPLRVLVPTDHGEIRVDGVGDCDTVEDLRRARLRAAAENPRSAAIDFDRVRAVVDSGLAPLPPRPIAVNDAGGCVLAQPLSAAAALPQVDISAMDGYAVSGEAPWTLRADVAYAGTSDLPALLAGEAVRIATGAAVPVGATAVVRDEFVEHFDGELTLRKGAPARDDRRRVGEDWHVGALLVPAGTVVSEAVMSVALSAEVTELTVRGPVRARILSSGSEIRVNGPLHPGQTRDTIGPVIPGYLRACGIDVVGSAHLEDSPSAFDDALIDPGDADMLIVIGATGGGAADRLRTALISADAHVLIDRVAVRPGGSQIAAVLPSGVVVLGLPGNPLAAIITTMTTGAAIADALTVRHRAPSHLGRVSNADAVRSSVTRIVPVTSQGMAWLAESHLRTAHLLQIAFHEALAVVPPDVTSDMPVELIFLP
ncbi:MAG: NTP transferase domain-containing protein [Rhodococcus sp. (in: high G+C Gram-positive bacteria)]